MRRRRVDRLLKPHIQHLEQGDRIMWHEGWKREGSYWRRQGIQLVQLLRLGRSSRPAIAAVALLWLGSQVKGGFQLLRTSIDILHLSLDCITIDDMLCFVRDFIDNVL